MLGQMLRSAIVPAFVIGILAATASVAMAADGCSYDYDGQLSTARRVPALMSPLVSPMVEAIEGAEIIGTMTATDAGVAVIASGVDALRVSWQWKSLCPILIGDGVIEEGGGYTATGA
jgi:hypothetical protein